MKLFYLLVSSCLSIFLFFVLQTIWGSAGINACAEMEQYKSQIQTNIEQLQDFEATMISDLARLQYDNARLRQEAYRIGMVGKNETRVRIQVNPNEMIAIPGNLSVYPKNQGSNQALILGITISFGVVLLLFLSVVNFESELIGGNKRRRKRTGIYQGTRVQTASLE